MPALDEPTILLHLWTCPTCGHAWNWAEVTVTNGLISSVSGAALSQATLARTHCAIDEVREVAAHLTGGSWIGVADDEIVRVLQERLPATDGWLPTTGLRDA